jgi:ABC-2 type transport system ATP-binding protein
MSIIEVKNLVKKFKIKNGEFVAVNNASFDVKKGEIFAFLGPNGAGKTTTIKMITTLLHPNSGEVKLNGFDVILNSIEARKSFGIVFQDPSLEEELTAYENMEIHGILYNLPKDLLRKRTEELLKFVELWERKDDFVKNFSGGMKRRLEIARGLLHHPKILFLDEPTLGLDPQTRNRIWSYIKNLNTKEEITVFFTTHYIEEAEKISNRVAIIDEGEIVIIDTLENILEKTRAKSLEEAFINLTGHSIRDEGVNHLDKMRLIRRLDRE